uniref:Uncharacterized protein n=1 Tax=Nelumbo nucifera TaxID=4432 RepID=A0A822Z6R4_NELNU|nr:TPA_asm: hypothetical protein HUJ06_014596 [Nelumbo nucifera]
MGFPMKYGSLIDHGPWDLIYLFVVRIEISGRKRGREKGGSFVLELGRLGGGGERERERESEVVGNYYKNTGRQVTRAALIKAVNTPFPLLCISKDEAFSNTNTTQTLWACSVIACFLTHNASYDPKQQKKFYLTFCASLVIL